MTFRFWNPNAKGDQGGVKITALEHFILLFPPLPTVTVSSERVGSKGEDLRDMRVPKHQKRHRQSEGQEIGWTFDGLLEFYSS